MRYMLLVLPIFCSCFQQVDATQVPMPYGSTLNLVVNLNNVQEAQTNNHNSFTRNRSESPLLDKLSEVWIDPRTNQNLLNRLGSNTNSFISEYKWPLLAATVAGTYAYCCYIIASGNSFLAQKDLWSSWRQDLAMDELLAIPQQQFAKELLQEIQRRYTDPAAITDIVKPLSKFMVVIEEEEQKLCWYQNAYSWLEYLQLAKIIPLNTAQFAKINQRLQRVAYFKNAFHTWAVAYQLEQVTKTRSITLESSIPDVTHMAKLMSYHYKISLLNYLAKIKLRRMPMA